MANNAVTRAIIARKPQKPAPVPPPEFKEPVDDFEKQARDINAPREQQQREALEKRFGALESKLFSTELGRGEREQDILARKFARLGGQLGSEAEQRAFGLAGREATKRLATGQEAISEEKESQRATLEDVLEGRRFATAERLRTEDAAAQEAEKQREFEADQAEKNRVLAEKELKIKEEELEINTKVSLENLAIAYGGEIPADVLKRLEEAGIDVSGYKISSKSIKQTKPIGTVEIDLPEVKPLPKDFDYSSLQEAPTVSNGGLS